MEIFILVSIGGTYGVHASLIVVILENKEELLEMHVNGHLNLKAALTHCKLVAILRIE